MTADERLALIRLKIERADKHIDDLRDALSAFFGSKPYKVTAQRDPQTRKMIYYLASVQPVPADISLITGDVIHCLRDALDHLAQQLYLVGTGNANGFRDKTGFPIMPSAEKFKSNFPGKVEGMRQDAIDAIRCIEPYPTGNGADLYTFHRLNNIDKHRIIVTLVAQHGGVGIGPLLMSTPGIPAEMRELMKGISLTLTPKGNVIPLKAGDQLFIDLPDAEEHKDMKFCFEITLNEPGVIEGKPIMETVMAFRDRISDIVNSFKPCLA